MDGVRSVSLDLYVLGSSGGDPSLSISTFSLTGANQTYLVPDAVTELYAVVAGAGGGNAGGGLQGPGAIYGGTIAVTPGETLNLFVGGSGGGGGTSFAGGYNGGGDGGNGGSGNVTN